MGVGVQVPPPTHLELAFRLVRVGVGARTAARDSGLVHESGSESDVV